MVEAIQKYRPPKKQLTFRDHFTAFPKSSQVFAAQFLLVYLDFYGLWCLEKVPKHGYPKWLLFNGDFPWDPNP